MQRLPNLFHFLEIDYVSTVVAGGKVTQSTQEIVESLDEFFFFIFGLLPKGVFRLKLYVRLERIEF